MSKKRSTLVSEAGKLKGLVPLSLSSAIHPRITPTPISDSHVHCLKNAPFKDPRLVKRAVNERDFRPKKDYQEDKLETTEEMSSEESAIDEQPMDKKEEEELLDSAVEDINKHYKLLAAEFGVENVMKAVMKVNLRTATIGVGGPMTPREAIGCRSRLKRGIRDLADRCIESIQKRRRLQ